MDCNFTNLRIRNNGAWSKYNGLQTEFKMRNFHGVTANVAYTWSKATDNVSGSSPVLVAYHADRAEPV